MRTKKFKLSKSNKITRISWIVLILFAVGGIYLTISTANAGAKLAYLEGLETKIVEENQRLKRELVELNSLKSLEVRAGELGFSRPDKLIYLTEDKTVAKIP